MLEGKHVEPRMDQRCVDPCGFRPWMTPDDQPAVLLCCNCPPRRLQNLHGSLWLVCFDQDLLPLLGLQFDLDAEALVVLTVGLLVGTPVLSLLGAIGAALTLGVRGGGALLSLLVLPLYIPTLIFGAGAVQAHLSGQGAGGHLSLLGALLAVSLFFAPWATTAALRISLE